MDHTRWSSMLITTPSASAGQRAGEVLHQHEGRAQAGLDVGIPGGAGGVVPFVALERAGVVHQHADRPERRGGLRQQRLGLPLRRRDRPAAAWRGGRGGGSRRRSRRRRRGWCGNARAMSKPASANASAMARPMRCAAPVTSAARGMVAGISVVAIIAAMPGILCQRTMPCPPALQLRPPPVG